MQRTRMPIALVFIGAVLLTGCSTGGGGATTSAAADPCQAVSVEVRDISNGSQNVLASSGDPSEMEASLKEYSDRVSALDQQYGSDTSTSEALGNLGQKVDDAAAFVATLPTDPGAEVDSEAVAAHQTAIGEAATAVNDACTS